MIIEIKDFWDGDAEIWVAESDEVPGLISVLVVFDFSPLHLWVSTALTNSRKLN